MFDILEKLDGETEQVELDNSEIQLTFDMKEAPHKEDPHNSFKRQFSAKHQYSSECLTDVTGLQRDKSSNPCVLKWFRSIIYRASDRNNYHKFLTKVHKILKEFKKDTKGHCRYISQIEDNLRPLLGEKVSLKDLELAIDHQLRDLYKEFKRLKCKQKPHGFPKPSKIKTNNYLDEISQFNKTSSSFIPFNKSCKNLFEPRRSSSAMSSSHIDLLSANQPPTNPLKMNSNIENPLGMQTMKDPLDHNNFTQHFSVSCGEVKNLKNQNKLLMKKLHKYKHKTENKENEHDTLNALLTVSKAVKRLEMEVFSQNSVSSRKCKDELESVTLHFKNQVKQMTLEHQQEIIKLASEKDSFISVLRSQNHSLEAQKKSLGDKIASLESSLEQTKTKKDCMTKLKEEEIQNLTTENRRLSALIQEQISEISSQIMQDNQSLLDKVQYYEDQAKEWEEKAQQFEEDRNNMQELLNKNSVENSELSEEVQKCHSTIRTLKEEIYQKEVTLRSSKESFDVKCSQMMSKMLRIKQKIQKDDYEYPRSWNNHF
ncbi:unnamed protein product [Moneuplotes crassus]|uniref:Uncharacterized protein n=1 Tax=Euplotes crassus TaxID=5936 RepID=A0AAD1U6M2_EUPCR|nr:unnamed protein product [Moneuplotes crassus]